MTIGPRDSLIYADSKGNRPALYVAPYGLRHILEVRFKGKPQFVYATERQCIPISALDAGSPCHAAPVPTGRSERRYRGTRGTRRSVTTGFTSTVGSYLNAWLRSAGVLTRTTDNGSGNP